MAADSRWSPAAQPQPKGARYTIELPGQVEAAEQTSLYPRLAGYVQKVHVDIGDRVKKGQVLAELSVPEIEADLKHKVALVAQAEAEVEHARRALQAAEGALVLAAARVQEAEAGIKHVQANHDRWKAEAQRLGELWSKKVIDKQTHDEGLRQLEAARAALAEAEAKGKAAQAAREEKASRRELARASIKVALARQTVAGAEVQRADALFQYAAVRAPYDGLVVWRGVNTGDFTGPGRGGKVESLFAVARIDSVRVLLAVPEAAAPLVAVGTRAVIRFPALKGQEVEGKLTRTAWTLDPASRILRAEIDLPNPEGKLRPGMFVRAVLTTTGPVEKPKQEAGPKEAATTGDPQALLKARLEVARKGYAEARQLYKQAGRASADQVCTWSYRWLQAQRAISSKKDNQIAALEAHRERLQDLQQRVKTMYQSGLVSLLEVTTVEFHRLEAELWLAREKAK